MWRNKEGWLVTYELSTLIFGLISVLSRYKMPAATTDDEQRNFPIATCIAKRTYM
jgi:hypothetical protein